MTRQEKYPDTHSYHYYNANPKHRFTSDCVIRAISLATGQTWDKTHCDLCLLSHERCTMPSVNWLWEIYLNGMGFEKYLLPANCPSCTTVERVTKRYPEGP